MTRDYNAKLAEARARLGGNLKARVSIVRWNPRGPVVITNAAVGAQTLTDLGLRLVTVGAGKQEHSTPLSLENLDRIDGDWIFLGTLNAAGPDVQAMNAARNLPVFARLGAVRNHHLVTVDGSMWTSAGGPLAAESVLSDAQTAMTQ